MNNDEDSISSYSRSNGLVSIEQFVRICLDYSSMEVPVDKVMRKATATERASSRSFRGAIVNGVRSIYVNNAIHHLS